MTESGDDDNPRDELTYHQRLSHKSRFWGGVWSVAEFCRLVAAGVAFIGPTFTLVTWLFDLLKQTFHPGQYPDALKEWFYYVLLVGIFVGISVPAWSLATVLQGYILRRFDDM